VLPLWPTRVFGDQRHWKGSVDAALPLGRHGEISIAAKCDHWVARYRWRGFDRVTRKVERVDSQEAAAVQAIDDWIAEEYARGSPIDVSRLASTNPQNGPLPPIEPR
jgi:hypothetical protein